MRLQILWHDLRYALRLLRKSPGFTITAIITLALGIGVNTTIFSWVNATLLNPIPGAPRADEVVAITNGGPGDGWPLSYPDFKDLRSRNHSFSGMTAFGMWPMSLTGRGKPVRVWGSLVTADYFDVLEVRPMLGRGFLPSEEQTINSAPAAVISYRLWRERFGGSRGIIGRTLQIDKHPFTIVGVTPPAFQGSYTGLRMEIWIPVTMQSALVSSSDNRIESRYTSWMQALGRLRPRVSWHQAQAEMNPLAQQIARQFPDSHKRKPQMTLYPLWRAPNGGNAFFSVLLPILMALAGVVLLLACVNVANLLLVRGVSRRKETAVRLSLGASRERLIRQFLTESVILALVGGALALAATFWTSRSFMDFAPVSDLPVWISVPVDRTVLLATAVISILTCALFAALPALRASALSPVGILKDESGAAGGGPRKTRVSSSLAVAQVSLSFILLISAGLLIRSFRAEQTFDPGFNAHDVLLESYDLFPSGYTNATGTAFDQQVLAKVRSLPGVTDASIATWTPLGFSDNQDYFRPEGYVPGPHELLTAGVNVVSPRYFSVMQIPILRGRDFAPTDSAKSQRVVIINQALASRYWGNQDAVGKRMWIDGAWTTVIGIVRTSHYSDLTEKPGPFVYLPLYQFYSPMAILHVRTAGDPLRLASAVSETIHTLNPDLPVFDVATLEARVKTASFVQRAAGTLAGAFGVLALALAGIGIYGVIAYGTRQRTHEIGIRMALGAQRADVMRLVLRRGIGFALLGVGIGMLAALGVTHLMSSLLFGVTPYDAATFGLVGGILVILAAAACYIPALRAMHIDPMVALRHE